MNDKLAEIKLRQFHLSQFYEDICSYILLASCPLDIIKYHRSKILTVALFVCLFVCFTADDRKEVPNPAIKA